MRQVRMPLTEAQQGIWMGQRLVPDSAVYWTAEAMSLHGPLRLDQWLQAVDHAVRHASSLHMQPTDDGFADYPQCLPPAACTPRIVDLSGQADPWAAAWKMAETTRPGPPRSASVAGPADALFQQALIKVGPQDHMWLLWAHHIVLDGYGFALLQQAAAHGYERLCQGEPLPCLAHWAMGPVVDEDLMARDSEPMRRAAAYWRQALSDARAVSFAPPVALAPSVRCARRTIEAACVTEWQGAAASRKTDWPSWLMAGVVRCLAAHSGALDLVLGLPVMNRMGSKAAIVPCMAMNIVPLRVRLQAGQSHAGLAAAIMQATRALRPHQRYRYERLRHDLGRMGGRRRLFGPVVNIMPFDRPLSAHDIGLGWHSVSAGPVEDLSINLVLLPEGGLRLALEANPLSYSQAVLEALADGLLAAWRSACEAPDGDLGLGAADSPPPRPWVRGADGRLHVQGPSLQGGPLPTQQGSAVLAAVAQHALQRGGDVAVQCPSSLIRYGELWAMAGRLAEQLSPLLPAGDGAKVLVMLPRHARTLALLLAVWRAGACYIPMDPKTPPERLALVLADARPHLVVTTQDQAQRLEDSGASLWTWTNASLDGEVRLARLTHLPPPSPPPSPLPRSAADGSADGTAYVIYTSGSTGRPNGVAISHAALAHFLAAAAQAYDMSDADRVLQFAPLHFDASIEELFLPLMAGANLQMRDDDMLASPQRFLQACSEKRITVMDLPTAYWHELAQALDSDPTLRMAWPPSVRLVIIGGEAAQVERVRRWRLTMPAHVRLLNTYGPTEATVICSTAVLAGPGSCELGEVAPIGLPLPGIELYIMPHADVDIGTGTGGTHTKEAGHLGQLYILGPTLAKGYLGQPGLTTQRFAPLPSTDAGHDRPRAYRTGDLVGIDRNGQLLFAGRVDDEIKISGYRIDPQEVESAMLACVDIEAVAVLSQTLPTGDKRLVAFVAHGQEPVRTASWWRERLMTRLPAPALPGCYVPLDHLPRNLNNKLDRQALLAMLPDAGAPDGAALAPAGPMTELEAHIAQTWQGLLGCTALHVGSDFFALGGGSLQAIQACTRLGLLLQREVPVSWLFANPTVTELAKALLSPVAHHPPPASAGHELAPLLPIQGRPQGAHDSPLLLCIHPAEGLSWCYFGLCRHLRGTEIWGIQSPGMTGDPFTCIDDLVTAYVAMARQVRPQGPYNLLGWSSGGGLAQAMAARLQAEGETVSLLAMMDAYPADIWEGKPEASEQDALEALLDVVGASSKDAQGRRLSAQAMREVLGQAGSPLAMLDEGLRERLSRNALDGMRLYRTLRHPCWQGPLLYFKAAIRPADAPLVETWLPHIQGQIDIIDIDSNHNGMSQPAPLAVIGRALAERIEGPSREGQP